MNTLPTFPHSLAKYVFALLTSLMLMLAARETQAQTGRWTHQIGVEIGPQYAFATTLKAYNDQTFYLTDVNVGVGAAVNYYYQFDRALFLSVSGAFGYFATGYFRRQNADGSYPILNTFYFNTANPLINLALTAGLRYNFAVVGFQPYVGLELGTYYIGGIPVEQEPGARTVPINLALTPKIGMRYPLAQGIDLDASAKVIALISGYVPFSYASLNIGVSFALNILKD
jgi:hypothetical protein